MVVGTRHTGLGVSRTATLLGFSRSTVSCVYQEWPTTQRTSNQLNTTVGNIGVNMGQHSYGTLSTPCICFVQGCWPKKMFCRWIHCCHEGMHLIGNNVQISCCIQTLLHFYQGAQCVHENTPHTTTSLQYRHAAQCVHVLVVFSILFRSLPHCNHTLLFLS
jgi:hypothetical protein